VSIIPALGRLRQEACEFMAWATRKSRSYLRKLKPKQTYKGYYTNKRYYTNKKENIENLSCI
jgi:hypothetical protein